jgi:hypothetical protein
MSSQAASAWMNPIMQGLLPSGFVSSMQYWTGFKSLIICPLKPIQEKSLHTIKRIKQKECMSLMTFPPFFCRFGDYSGSTQLKWTL